MQYILGVCFKWSSDNVYFLYSPKPLSKEYHLKKKLLVNSKINTIMRFSFLKHVCVRHELLGS